MRVVLFLNLLLEIVKYILAGEAVFNISLIKRYRVGLFAALSMTILALCINDLSLIHISGPRDPKTSRMPSSA